MEKILKKLRLQSSPLARACIAEIVGTAILVIFGCGVLVQVIVGSYGKSAHGGFMSISLGWGMAVMMGVFYAGGGGPGLINPAVTLAFTLIGKVKPKELILFSLSQYFGAFLGALIVFLVYYEKLQNFAEEKAGQFLMNHTGMAFVTMPGEGVTNIACFFDQVFGTFLLTSGALAIIDGNSWKMPSYLHPFMIGMMVFTIVGSFGMNAGAALNPARDLGPRIMIAICGWGSEAFTAFNYYFWIPVLGPYLGAVLGGLFYQVAIGIHLNEPKRESNKDLKHEKPNSQMEEQSKLLSENQSKSHHMNF